MQGMTPQFPGFPGQPPMGQPPMGQQPTGQQPMMGQPPMMHPGQMMGQPPMMPPGQMGQGMIFGGIVPTTTLPSEQSYVENILRMNRGKVATIYTTNENNPEWPAKIFKGRVENAARDHVILSDPQTGMRYIILMVNIDYITFDEQLRYEPGIYRQ